MRFNVEELELLGRDIERGLEASMADLDSYAKLARHIAEEWDDDDRQLALTLEATAESMAEIREKIYLWLRHHSPREKAREFRIILAMKDREEDNG